MAQHWIDISRLKHAFILYVLFCIVEGCWQAPWYTKTSTVIHTHTRTHTHNMGIHLPLLFLALHLHVLTSIVHFFLHYSLTSTRVFHYPFALFLPFVSMTSREQHTYTYTHPHTPSGMTCKVFSHGETEMKKSKKIRQTLLCCLTCWILIM